MAKISGILTDGAGKIINNCTIELYAKRTTNKVLAQTQAFEVAENGSYTMNVLPCDYEVKLIINGFPPKKLGTIQVFSDSKDGTLNDFLLNPVESEITPAILQQVVNARNAAKKSADDAKKFASTIDTATLVKKSGDEMTGTLRINDGDKSAIQLQNAAGQIWQQRTFADGSFCLERYNSVLNQWIRFLRYVEPENSWKFENIDDVTINNKSVLKSGDYGVGAVVGAIAENFDGHLAGGFYQCSTSDFSDLQFAGDSAATLLTYPSNSKSWKVEQLSVVSSKTPKIYYRCDTRDGKQKWYEAITTANSTVDSNGFLKKASPILRLFATENIDDVDDFKKSGCSLVNDLAAGVTAKRIDIGHYEISGSLGFAKEGWYITLPEDANGNKKFFAEYSTDENNIITVKTYTRKFDFESCQIVAGEPIDITEGRWIDIRLEMPVVEVIENEEPIPSTLNPVIINNDEN
ncbi:hypothetical protein A9G41_12110 [Gilliamella sp. Nev5-1]|nr:prophage tail fiber N-terminal domain-containing protein [Gilliamella apicola]OCG59803.1 hypothetical protein A9G40_06200 [Gilliamella apicola]OCG66831.1 hypothetical protein A9G41_12110 [Gilliamella apicola]